jgi:hypothetical protein
MPDTNRREFLIAIMPLLTAPLLLPSLTSPVAAANELTANNTGIEGSIEKIWIDLGVKSKTETGIRIHTKFSVRKALGIECVVKATVIRADGQSVWSMSNTFATKDGKVVVSKRFTPPYDPSDYPDTRFFIPYWAFDLKAKNPNKLKLTVELLSGGRTFAVSGLSEYSIPVG